MTRVPLDAAAAVTGKDELIDMNGKRLLALVLASAMLCCSVPAVSAADADKTAYVDVPGDSWAVTYIETARDLGLMQGISDDQFGYGGTVTNAQFAQMICNIMGWELLNPSEPTYSDVLPESWYYQAVETAYANGVYDKMSAFSPESAITRREMARAFVSALGLGAAADLEEHMPSQFADVYSGQGSINVAKMIGLLQGKSETTFAPDATAKREEAAALLVRFYETYYAETDFVHGFYAISSYSQRELAAKMDAVTYMWSTMTLEDGAVKLDTTSKEYRVPDGYDSITGYLGSGVKQHLGVFMNAYGGVDDLLADPASRTAAVQAVLTELNRTYDAIGRSPYSGVTIDFEGLRGQADRENLNSFLTDLSAQLKNQGKTLYVAVHPALVGGYQYDGYNYGQLREDVYFDGYDYKTIGALSDKVILMAHDFAPQTLEGWEGTEWYLNAALTPIAGIYYALRAITDPDTGVEDHSKLVLALSFDARGWYIDRDGKLESAQSVSVSISRVAEVLSLPDTEIGYSDAYRNPYLIYQTDEGERIFLWYENEKSIQEKLSLAKCFGVTGVSVWRLGNIPNEPAYDVTGAFLPKT